MERDLEKGPGPREEVWGPSRFPHLRPGAEVIYNELMSDFEMDEKDFTADSWSLAVDSSFLQQHKKMGWRTPGKRQENSVPGEKATR